MPDELIMTISHVPWSRCLLPLGLRRPSLPPPSSRATCAFTCIPSVPLPTLATLSSSSMIGGMGGWQVNIVFPATFEPARSRLGCTPPSPCLFFQPRTLLAPASFIAFTVVSPSLFLSDSSLSSASLFASLFRNSCRRSGCGIRSLFMDSTSSTCGSSSSFPTYPSLTSAESRQCSISMAPVTFSE